MMKLIKMIGLRLFSSRSGTNGFFENVNYSPKTENQEGKQKSVESKHQIIND